MRLSNVRKVYHNKKGDVVALDNINLSLENKGMVIIQGSSGSGKTTLLNILANSDHAYEGSIDNFYTSSYITQDTTLFDNMSIYDNLLNVCNNRKIINKYIHKFGLEEVKKRKVKKCSNGQKKRVQLLCGFLNGKQMMLCDEPTAALDHDNAEEVMQMLKKIAKQKLVMIVTHDIALSEKYADRIIKIEKGKIIADEILNDTAINDVKNVQNVKSVIRTFKLVMRDICSKPFSYLMLSILLLIGGSCLYLATNLFFSLNAQLDYNEAFENGTNIVVEYNQSKKFGDITNLDLNMVNLNGRVYVDYDYIAYDKLKTIIADNPEIIAYEANVETFEYANYVGENKNDNGTFKFILDDFKDQQYIDDITGNLTNSLFDVSYRPRHYPFISSANVPNGSLYHDNKAYLDFVKLNEDYIKNSVNIFHLCDYDELPLLYGEYVNNANDIIIDQKVAKMIMDEYDIDDMEKLIDMDVELKQRTYAYYHITNSLLDLPSYDNFVYKIKGIASITNDELAMIFMVTDVVDDPLLATHLISADDLKFQNVRFILDPACHIAKTILKINDEFGLANSSFAALADINLQKNVLNRHNEDMLMYLGLLFIGIVTLLMIYYLLQLRTLRKEARLLRSYGYKFDRYIFIKHMIIGIVAFMIMLMISHYVLVYLNEIAITYGYSYLLEDNSLYVLLSWLMMEGITMAINRILVIKND